MIERMTRYDFILLSGQKEEFIRELGTLGVMDITRSFKPVDEKSRDIMSRLEAVKAEIRRISKGTDAHLQELKAARSELFRESESLVHWGEYDRARLDSLGIPVSFYCVPDKSFDKAWEEEYPLEVLDTAKGKTWFVVFGGAKLPVAALKEQESALSGELSRYLAGIGGEKAADGALTVFEGFAPESEKERLAAAFDNMSCVWTSSEATVEDNPPIKLRNNKFVKQFETLTDMYGRPDYNEFDPTPYLSVFFLLFFAMCMGDAGYGLVLIIGGILLKKVEGMKKLAPLVTILGVGTFVVGIVMHTFFGVDISALPWIPSWLKAVMITGTIAGFEAQMVLSLAIGVIHLCLAMVVKTVYATRNRGFLGSLGIWGWTLLIVGGVVVGALAMFSLLPPEVTKWIIIGLGVVSAMGIFLFNDINRNPLKNIGSGLWETYNTAVTGLLGDVLSYLRLYALGLAGGMLGNAFNSIAAMTLGDGSFGIGWLAFVLILVIGHALNLAMCCLGAFVHPLRLNFLEFFKNSGYDGRGRQYRPIGN